MLAIDWTQGFEDAWNDVATFIPKFVAALAVFIIGWFVAKLIRKVVVRVQVRAPPSGLRPRSSSSRSSPAR